ncbi:hypothetical protein Taro_042548, partial [Colocasia esculenta]|nr:hypothetical protein [Colocasia esculenta]
PARHVPAPLRFSRLLVGEEYLHLSAARREHQDFAPPIAMATPLQRRVISQPHIPHLFSSLLSRSRSLSTDALVEIKPGEIGLVSGIPEEHRRRKRKKNEGGGGRWELKRRGDMANLRPAFTYIVLYVENIAKSVEFTRMPLTNVRCLDNSHRWGVLETGQTTIAFTPVHQHETDVLTGVVRHADRERAPLEVCFAYADVDAAYKAFFEQRAVENGAVPVSAPEEEWGAPTDEWEVIARDEEVLFDTLHSAPPARLVFGSVPTLEKAKEATSYLKDAVKKLNLFISSSTTAPHLVTLFLPLVSSRVAPYTSHLPLLERQWLLSLSHGSGYSRKIRGRTS